MTGQDDIRNYYGLMRIGISLEVAKLLANSLQTGTYSLRKLYDALNEDIYIYIFL
jgi:hypothetical protein